MPSLHFCCVSAILRCAACEGPTKKHFAEDDMSKRDKNGRKSQRSPSHRPKHQGTVTVRPGATKCPRCNRTIPSPAERPFNCKQCKIKFTWI